MLKKDQPAIQVHSICLTSFASNMASRSRNGVDHPHLPTGNGRDEKFHLCQSKFCRPNAEPLFDDSGLPEGLLTTDFAAGSLTHESSGGMFARIHSLSRQTAHLDHHSAWAEVGYE